MFDPKKRRISLEEYLSETKKPEGHFTEDSDYIIFQDNDRSSLKIYIDKNTYYSIDYKAPFDSHTGFSYLIPQTATRLFDMMTVKYRPPYMPIASGIDMMLGQYLFGKEGPSFYITEPKHATHALFYNLPRYPSSYRTDDIAINDPAHAFADEDYQVMPLETVFKWMGRIMYISEPDWERNRFMRKYQVQFYHDLNSFYGCQEA